MNLTLRNDCFSHNMKAALPVDLGLLDRERVGGKQGIVPILQTWLPLGQPSL